MFDHGAIRCADEKSPKTPRLFRQWINDLVPATSCLRISLVDVGPNRDRDRGVLCRSGISRNKLNLCFAIRCFEASGPTEVKRLPAESEVVDIELPCLFDAWHAEIASARGLN